MKYDRGTENECILKHKGITKYISNILPPEHAYSGGGCCGNDSGSGDGECCGSYGDSGSRGGDGAATGSDDDAV